MPPTTARWLAVALLIAITATAQALDLVTALRYDRAALASGQVWRLLTAHLVHLNAIHAALNATGLVLVAALVGAQMRLWVWGWVFAVSAVTIGLGLWLLVPDLVWYVGLSGVLHGLLAAGATVALGHRRERLFAGVILTLVTLKLAWEQAYGPLPGTATAAGDNVIVDAHLLGTIGGMVALATLGLVKRLRPGTPPTPGR